jgi:hypothetical protein
LKKVFILHLLPLEYYPPVTNLIEVFGQDHRFSVQVFSSHNHKKREVFKSSSSKIFRSVYPAYASNAFFKLWAFFSISLKPLWYLWCFKPDTLVYLEPHSALPAYLYKRFFRPKVRLYIHHHEYYSPDEFYAPGMSSVRWFHQLETSYLFRKATWISQTNAQRIDLFHKDYPYIQKEVLHTLANYPPKSWSSRKSQRKPGGKVSLLYVGALSFENTHIEALVNFINANSHLVILTIYSFNTSPAVGEFLERQDPTTIRYFKDGINYQEIPKVASNYDIGLILYTGHNLNYTFNAPNKLFEYLACGLDVWVPIEMEGCKPFLNEIGKPVVKMIDFKKLNAQLLLDFNEKIENTIVKSDYSCEKEALPLVESILKDGEY